MESAQGLDDMMRDTGTGRRVTRKGISKNTDIKLSSKDHLLRRWLYTTPLKGAIFELILQQLHLLFDLLVLLILMPHVSPDNFFVYSYRIDKVSPCPK